MLNILIGIVAIESVALAWLIFKKRPPLSPKHPHNLADVLSDLSRFGFVVVRINPDDMLLRSPRQRG